MVDVGTTIQLKGRSVPFQVIRHVAGGGEGDVYELSDGQERLALKWYHEKVASPARYEIIRLLVKRGAPSDSFLWPLGLIEADDTDRFGYIMPFRPDGYVGLGDLLTGKVPRREEAVLRFSLELAQAYLALHTQGLCYRDINFGNSFFHPELGHALICDNDNVDIDGVRSPQVLGTPAFMAPEILAQGAEPSKYTDRHSLAVLLFYLMFLHHPLEGMRTAQGDNDRLGRIGHFALNPLFCFDPNDRSNRPVPDAEPNPTVRWEAAPDDLRALFVRAFTVGLKQPGERVVDAEWCEALADLGDRYFPCADCGRACYLDGDRTPETCGTCGAGIDSVMALCFGGRHIVAREGAVLTSDRVRGDFDHSAVGAIEAHPTTPGLLGLRNETDRPWHYRDRSQKVRFLQPQRRASLVVGAEIGFEGAWTRVVALSHHSPCCR